MGHKGIREWSGEELSNVALGQNGFHILTADTDILASDKGITYWIALKAVDGAATVKAQSYGTGDDLSTTGAYAGSEIELADGDIVYGSFDKVTVDGSDHIVAYIGK
jgi:hypothetical protein